MFFRAPIFVLLQLTHLSLAAHYKGGSISWKPISAYLLTNPIQIIITERHSWTFSRYPCTTTLIGTFGSYGDTQAVAPATVSCISSAAACTSSGFQTINGSLYCTDFSAVFQISTGTYYTTQSMTLNSIIDISWRGATWTNETLTNGWSVVSHMDLTPVGNKINTSPVTGSLPIFQVYVGEKIVMPIIVSDWDSDQVVRCRWSYQIALDECGDVCMDLPNAVLSELDCTITWTPVLRSADLANGLNRSTYVIAISAEDFTNSSSTTALSSVPHQVLVYVSPRPAGTCPNRPYIAGFPRRNLACYSVGVGGTLSYQFRSIVYCSNDSIVEFISSSPFMVNKSDIYQVSNGTWGITITWTTLSSQIGLQPFCMVAVDNNGQTSTSYCVMTAVGGGSNFNVGYPSFVQGSASPVGTVLATQTRFSIQSSFSLKRPILNQTYIRIYRFDNNAQVYLIDCKYSPDVYFLNNTLVFYVRNPPWIAGLTYFITSTDGVATADRYCGIEGNGFGGNYWRFTIWSGSLSSTTTPSTTTSTVTTHTLTTRFIGTSTYNTLYTTTGLSAVPTPLTTSMTSSTTTSVSSTTSTTASSTTTTTTTTTAALPDATVIYPKDMELACVQPVTIATAVVSALAIPLHLLAMINLFVKMNTQFQKELLQTKNARRLLSKSALEHEEEETLV